MKTRQILVITTLILSTMWHTAAAQPKKKNTQPDAPRPESILAGASMQSNPVLSDLIAAKPEMPLGPGNPLGASSLDMGGLCDLNARNLDLHQSGAGVLRLSERGERKYKNECGAQGFRTHSYLSQ